MARKLKVYGWTANYNSEQLRADLGDKPWHSQCHAAIAASSMAEVARLARVARPSQLFCLSETGNQLTIDTCLAKPRTFFVQSIHGGRKPFIEYDPTRHGRIS